MFKVGPWVDIDNGAYRAIEGRDGEVISNRVAFIEKTPRVRIRYNYDWANWEDWLNWASGVKGDGPTDKESREWCDKMLVLLGYNLGE